MVDFAHFLAAVSVLVLAMVIDLLFGDPTWRLHPTFWTGKLIMALEPYIRNKSPKIEKLNGVLLALVIITMWTVPAYVLLKFLSSKLGMLPYVIMAALFFKLTFSIKLETTWATAAAKNVETSNLVNGRQYVSYFSRRDITNLNGPAIVSAIVESIAENLSDFKLSSILYYAFLGVSGAMAFRAINNLDSVVGFKDEQHINIGWFSATLDTLANYIPSRMSAILIVFAALILGENWKGAWKIARRDHEKISSINHGWPIAAMAGALNVQLEKPGYYAVGDQMEELSPDHIRRTLRIRYVVILLCVVLLLPSILLVNLAFLF